jgi:hypothetical protein
MAKNFPHEFAEAVQASSSPTEIILEIDGLRDLGNGTFALRGVMPIDVDHHVFEELEAQLVDRGVHKRLAIRLCEEAFGSVQDGLLADAIAQRTRRVG